MCTDRDRSPAPVKGSQSEWQVSVLKQGHRRMTGEKQKASGDSEDTGSREWPHPGAAQTGPVAV